MSDQQLLSNIEKVIRKASVEGVLTEKAISEFNNVLNTNQVLNTELTELKKKFAKLEEKQKEFIDKCASQASTIDSWKRREDSLIEREKEMTRLELEARYDRERVSDHKEMFELVFRNIEVRRNIFTAVPGINAGQYGSQVSPYVHQDTQKETQE